MVRTLCGSVLNVELFGVRRSDHQVPVKPGGGDAGQLCLDVGTQKVFEHVVPIPLVEFIEKGSGAMEIERETRNIDDRQGVPTIIRV